MIEQLPEGNSIGWMQAPPQWIFSHTVRFIGIVRIIIQDGEGFILIKKGKPVYYYFKHGRIELKGHSALDYFNSHPIIEFNLCKYTADEFADAMRMCIFEENSPDGLLEPESQKAVIFPPVHVPPAQPVQPKEPVPVGEPVLSSFPEKLPEKKVVLRPIITINEIPVNTPPTIPQTVVLEESDIKLIGQIKKLNGIIAISVFDDERNIFLMGDVDIEPLLQIARSMLATIRKISPMVEWGSFVHMTLQVPEGNIIIASFHDYYLCLLTTRTINIGHIRRILRDLQLTTNPRDG